jgi:hypothetical protein
MADLLDRMHRNPAADWAINDVAAACSQHGVRCTPPTGGGSHCGRRRRHRGRPADASAPFYPPVRLLDAPLGRVPPRYRRLL